MIQFVHRFSSVTGQRLDPHFHRPEFSYLQGRIQKVPHARLYDLVSLSSEQWDQKSHFDDDFPYIEIGSVDLFLGRLGKPSCVPVKEAPSRAKLIVRPNYLLVSLTRPTRGAICFIEKSLRLAVASNGFAVIHGFNENRIKPRYLFHILRSQICTSQFDQRSSGGNYPAITEDQILRITIPTPKLQEQELISQKLDHSYIEAESKLCNAERLLASIDDVLLDELGIPRQPEPPNTLESRIFRRDFSTLSGKRIDPAANWKHLSFDGGKFPLRRLRDVASINPVTRFPKLELGTPVSFVPMDAVSDVFGEIADRQTRPIEEAGSYTPFQNGDVIWAKITPCMENGKAAVADRLVEGVGYGSTEFHVFRRRIPELFPHYLHHLLRLKTVREHARRNFTGSSGHQRVDENFFYRMEIPFPSMKIQERIAEKAEATKAQARKLFADARADLEKAKRDIEALILGKEAAE